MGRTSLERPGTGSSTGSGRASGRPRERHGRLSAGLRRPAGPAPASSSPPPSGFPAWRAGACALVTALALLLGAGAAEALDVPLALDSATVDGAVLKLVFNNSLDRNSVPAKGSFSVSLAGAAEPPTGVSVDGRTVTLTLATAAAAGRAALVTYTKPGTKPLRHTHGREVQGFAGQKAINVAGGVATAEAGADQEVLTGAAVTLSGTASSTRPNPAYTYAWTQTGGRTVALTGAGTAEPTFTAPSVREDLVFALTVNDGVADSTADTVTVRVRPPPNPTSAPCAHPAPQGTAFHGGSLLDSVSVTESTITFSGTGLARSQNSFWLCRPDGTRSTLAQNVAGGHSDTVTGLARATRYWLAVKWTDINGVVRWQAWQAVFTGGTATAHAGPDQAVESGSTVTLSGSGSSTLANPSWSYRWTPTEGTPTLTLAPGSSWNSASPSFTAPTVRTDLVFALVVNDGANDSAADTVAVQVRPPPNPTSAPCVQPTAGTEATGLFVVTATTDSSIGLRGTHSGGGNVIQLWFCRPDGTREKLGENLLQNQVRTASGLASGTTYWVTALEAVPDEIEDFQERWQPWQAVTTTGAASIKRVRFTSSPALGDTYLRGETIRAEVTWSKPVTVNAKGSSANVHLRLDVGADDANRGNSRRTMAYVSGSETDTLTFEYAVAPGDADPDGVWLQTESATDDHLVAFSSGATIRDGTTDAKLTRAGLPTTGDATRKVDGTSTATAEAGPDQEVVTGSTVTLSGSGSSKRASPSLSYRWAQTGGVSVTLSGAATASPTFTAPSVRTDLVFTLVVNDGAHDSAADTVAVRVRPPPNPTSAPCAHPKPADVDLSRTQFMIFRSITDSSVQYSGLGRGSSRYSFW